QVVKTSQAVNVLSDPLKKLKGIDWRTYANSFQDWTKGLQPGRFAVTPDGILVRIPDETSSVVRRIDAGDGKKIEGMGKFDRVISSIDDLSDASKSKITTSQRATLNQQERTYSHLTEMDLKGAQRDLDGNPVPKPGGGYYDHAQEVSDAYRGLVDLKRSWEGMLKNPNLDAELCQFYTSKLNEVNNTMKMIEDMFAPHGGVFPPK
ncbi:polymorphic toxin type 28 domain-containing protein, partial [Paenibacillus aquistagni]|uniref:polymorphic toxin type 28 domain-containing protein n=1 Tax=Paenibacillus aquistagni TaxID=1852522 RepID=UPI001827ADA9